MSNLGLLIQGVGAAWAMTQMGTSADKVAMVQTALLLPVLLFALPAGAIADTYDRRIVALIALMIAFCGAVGLTLTAWFHLATPDILLALCFTVGSGIALQAPAWQSSVLEQVPSEALPAAVALNGISYNIARSVGPAVGGVVVATAGAVASFAINAICYLPIIGALLAWKRIAPRSHLPREKLGRAMISGVRFIQNSPAIGIVLSRALVTGVLTGSIAALMPLVAKDVLHGGARTYGLLLGGFGLGAVLGALCIPEMRRRMSGEGAVRVNSLLVGAAVATIAVSHNPFLTAAAAMLAGGAWTMALAVFNISVQLSSPRWAAGRSVAAYQAAIAGGMAIGSWWWGRLTDLSGVQTALLVSGVLILASPLLAIWLRIPDVRPAPEGPEHPEQPEMGIVEAGYGGPLSVEHQYRVAPEQEDAFRAIMRAVQLMRQRTGVFGWSIARDVDDPRLWIERYRCANWHEYLRHRSRLNRAERALDQRASEFHDGAGALRIRRMLERPFRPGG